MEVIDYQSIRNRVVKLGKEEKVQQRAKELQVQLSEPGDNIPFEDAYEMAYNEMVESSSFSF